MPLIHLLEYCLTPHAVQELDPAKEYVFSGHGLHLE